MVFGRFLLSLHPATALFLWLLATVAIQFQTIAGILWLAIPVILPSVFTIWWRFLRRTRWLLVSLWLVLAYSVPGEAWADLPWAPTYEGFAEANLHALRLLVMLVWVAALFALLKREGLIAGLWSALLPLRLLGIPTGTVVVRLSLVLDHLQTPLPAGGWRHMLAGEVPVPAGGDILRIEQVSARTRDYLAALGGLILFVVGLP